MIKASLIDPKTGQRVHVTEEGAIPVVVHPHPPVTDSLVAIPFVNFFETDAGASDMRVSGSSGSPFLFKINASPTRDTFISQCSVVIADGSATLNKFGNITALTNGVKFEWITADLGTVEIGPSLKSNFDFVQLGSGTPPIGAGTTSFRASNVEGASEAFIPSINLSSIFGIPYGLRLRKGTKDCLCWTVQDNTSAVDRFDIKAFGTTI